MSHIIIDLVSSDDDEKDTNATRSVCQKRPAKEETSLDVTSCSSSDVPLSKKPRAAIVPAVKSSQNGRHKRTSLKRAGPGLPPPTMDQGGDGGDSTDGGDNGVCIDIHRNDGDDGIVTSGILPLLSKFPFSQESTLLCCHYTPLLQCSCSSCSSSQRSIRDHHVLHIQQRDKWSCGFRNLQMLLSFLMPNLALSHPFWNLVPIHSTVYATNHQTAATTKQHSNNNSIRIPSVKQLQSSMEESWGKGYDTRGAAHFRHGIVGRPSKVGAVELSSLLTYYQLDSTVIQFVVCSESRSLLGRFVMAYFDRCCLRCRFSSSCTTCGETSAGGTVEIRETSDILARGILERLECDNTFSNRRLDSNIEESCPNAIPPLYLQWEGHSVTIVGVEMEKGPKQHCNFLVLDPLKSGTTLKEDIYTTVQNFGFLNDDKDSEPLAFCLPNSLPCLDLMRLSTKKLLQTDCQLVLATMDPLKNITRSECNAITAANRTVERVVNANPSKYF